MVNHDVLKVTFYSVCGASCALYSIHSMYKAFIQHRKIMRMIYTPVLQPIDLEVPDYQVINSHSAVGYFKIQGRISSSKSLISPNGVECLYYESIKNYSKHENSNYTFSRCEDLNYPLYVRCYNGIVDNLSALFYLGKRLVIKWHNPLDFNRQFVESSGVLIEKKSCELTLCSYDGISVLMDLDGSSMELNQIGNEKLVLKNDHFTAIGFVHMKESQLIMSKPLFKWYLITNKESNLLLKTWWKYLVFGIVKGAFFSALSYYSFYKIDMLIEQLHSIPIMVDPSQPSFWEWLFKMVKTQ
eukprot:NODE_927_length_3031_cov_0.186562.p1 type:complete len:299 gc:universal NODE_927_length_3031_cov_0.186562:447-1343(+)